MLEIRSPRYDRAELIAYIENSMEQSEGNNE